MPAKGLREKDFEARSLMEKTQAQDASTNCTWCSPRREKPPSQAMEPIALPPPLLAASKTCLPPWCSKCKHYSRQCRVAIAAAIHAKAAMVRWSSCSHYYYSAESAISLREIFASMNFSLIIVSLIMMSKSPTRGTVTRTRAKARKLSMFLI